MRILLESMQILLIEKSFFFFANIANLYISPVGKPLKNGARSLPYFKWRCPEGTEGIKGIRVVNGIAS